MKANEWGSDDWWIVVQSMPFIERLEQLEAYKAKLNEETNGKSDQNNTAKFLTRVNSELKSLKRRIEQSTWQRACKDVLTEDQFAAVQQQKRYLEETLPEEAAVRSYAKEKA